MDLEALKQNEIYKFMFKNKINPLKVNLTKQKGESYIVSGDITDEQYEMINKIIRENNEIYELLKLVAKYKYGSMNKLKEITGNSSFPALIKRWIKTGEKILPYFDCKIVVSGIDKNNFCTCEKPLIKQNNDETECGHCLKSIRFNKKIIS